MTVRPALRVLALRVLVVGMIGEATQLVLVLRFHAVDLLPWGIAVLVLPISTLAVGGLLVHRRPALPIGWLLLGVGALVAVESGIGALGEALLAVVPDAAQVMLWYGGSDSWGWVPPLGLLFTQVLLRFPDGHLPSPEWRWFSRATLVAIVVLTIIQATLEPTVAPGIPNPTFVSWPGGPVIVSAVGSAVFGPALLGSVVSLVVRYRRADPVARAQLRWIFWASAVIVGLLILSWLGDPTNPGIAGVLDLVVSSIVALLYSLLPIAIFVAVTRYGLYSIDRIITRTAAYAIVSVGIIGLYVVIVLLGSLLFPRLPSIGIAAATLGAAAAFLPFLRAVRRRVDRRFDRARYDAEKVVDAFGERIRSGADPHRAGDDLVDAVQLALQPSTIGIWRPEGTS